MIRQLLLLISLFFIQAGVRAEIQTLVPKKSLWKYNDTGTDLGTGWRAAAYADGAWASGIGWLGYGDVGLSTALGYGPDAANKYPCYYFRHSFSLPNAPATYSGLHLKLKRDDGAIVYLNGTEILRTNMPAGAVSYTTLASATVGGADEETYFDFYLPVTGLVAGTNVLAVEVHQSTANSSDLRFDLELEGAHTGPQTYSGGIAAASYWAYWDQGSLPGATWQQGSFDHSAWPLGRGPLGYSDPVINTTVSYGANAANKYRTTYFVAKFTVANAASVTSMDLGLMLDDGAVVYINGTEVHRYNMPAGAVAYNTLATSAIGGTDETDWTITNLATTSMLVTGTNTIAVEVHQSDAGSSDKIFDLTLTLNTGGGGPVCNPGADSNIGTFVSVDPAGRNAQLNLPCTHRYQLLRKQGDAHTSGGGSFGDLVDFTGFIPKSGSSTSGYLSVNHETSPGGVSILEVDYDNGTHLWSVGSSRGVSFAAVGQTYRNCSGGVTPWGTVITAEEGTTASTIGSGDNAGYETYGWLVEINPATAAVMDHAADVNTTADKLWAMGTMDHENVVVSNDEVTAYYGSDNGTYGYVYKFVANSARDLSQGTLYVLTTPSRNAAASTGTWAVVPNGTIAQRNTTRELSDGLLATNFNGVEDAEIGPDGKIYFTAKGTGRVYRFTDNGATVSNLETFVGAMSYNITHSGGTSSVAWGTGNDNLAFDNQGNLWVLQDGGNDYIWVVAPTHTQASPQVRIFSTIPSGAEPTGLTFSPDGAFGFLSIQAPSGTNTAGQTDEAGVTYNNHDDFTLVIGRSEVLGDEATYGTLPIDGLQLEARSADQQSVQLVWTTRSEINTRTFEVERSDNGYSYHSIGSTPAAGMSDSPLAYQMTDASPLRNQRIYYRIKATDLDGHSTLSNVASIRLDDALYTAVYPNPVTDKATLQLSLPTQQPVSVRLLDMTGRIVFTDLQQHTLMAGTHLVQLADQITALNNGLYILQVVTPATTENHRIWINR